MVAVIAWLFGLPTELVRQGELVFAGVLPVTAALTLMLVGSLVLIVTAHSQVDYALVARESRLIVDTRNALARVPDGELRARVVRA